MGDFTSSTADEILTIRSRQFSRGRRINGRNVNYLSWTGRQRTSPSPFFAVRTYSKDQLSTIALDCLGEYLSDSAVSILSQTFIEIEDPVATSIGFYSSYQLPCTLSIHFSSVPVEHLDTLEDQLFDVLRKVAKDGIDMERMKTVIETGKSRYVLMVERSPANCLSHKLINEALYGSLDGKTLKEEVQDLPYYDQLLSWTSDQWVALLKR